MTSLIRAFFFDPLERLTWHLCLCNVTNSKKKKKKKWRGLLSAYVMRDAISCSDFVCRVYAKMLHLSDTGGDNAAAVVSLDLSDILIEYHVGFNRISPTASENCFLFFWFVYLFPFHSCTHQRRRLVWLTNMMIARLCRVRPKDHGGVCSPMHNMRRGGQMTRLAKWWSSTACAWERGGSFSSLFAIKGCRGRRVDVCEIHHTAASLAQWSVKLSPSSAKNPLLHLLISSPQSCARWPFVYSSFPTIHASNHHGR